MPLLHTHNANRTLAYTQTAAGAHGSNCNQTHVHCNNAPWWHFVMSILKHLTAKFVQFHIHIFLCTHRQLLARNLHCKISVFTLNCNFPLLLRPLSIENYSTANRDWSLPEKTIETIRSIIFHRSPLFLSLCWIKLKTSIDQIRLCVRHYNELALVTNFK